MRSDQRKKLVQWFYSTEVQVPASGQSSASQDGQNPRSSQSSSLTKSLSIRAEESRIHTIPFVTLQSMWCKAGSLVNSENMIMPAPGTDK